MFWKIEATFLTKPFCLTCFFFKHVFSQLMVDWLFGSFGGSGIRSGIPLSIHPNPFKMFGDPIGNPKPPNAPNHPLTITWNAKCVIFLGNFTPKTSNYCLKNRALGFPGSCFFPCNLRSDSFVEFPKGIFKPQVAEVPEDSRSLFGDPADFGRWNNPYIKPSVPLRY